MNQWEYCVLARICLGEGFDTNYPTLTYFSINGIPKVVELGDRHASARPEAFRYVSESGYVASVIANLGLEGWELVGCGNTGETMHSLYFKRPKE